MQTNTMQKYQTRARNFYREHCKSEAPDSAQICAALLAQAKTQDQNQNPAPSLKADFEALVFDHGRSQTEKALPGDRVRRGTTLAPEKGMEVPSFISR